MSNASRAHPDLRGVFACQPDGGQCVPICLRRLNWLGSSNGGVRSHGRLCGGCATRPGRVEKIFTASEETKMCTHPDDAQARSGVPRGGVADLAAVLGFRREAVFRRDGGCELRFAGRRTAGFDDADADRKKREEAEEIRLLYVATTRAKSDW